MIAASEKFFLGYRKSAVAALMNFDLRLPVKQTLFCLICCTVNSRGVGGKVVRRKEGKKKEDENNSNYAVVFLIILLFK